MHTLSQIEFNINSNRNMADEYLIQEQSVRESQFL